MEVRIFITFSDFNSSATLTFTEFEKILSFKTLTLVTDPIKLVDFHFLLFKLKIRLYSIARYVAKPRK